MMSNRGRMFVALPATFIGAALLVAAPNPNPLGPVVPPPPTQSVAATASAANVNPVVAGNEAKSNLTATAVAPTRIPGGPTYGTTPTWFWTATGAPGVRVQEPSKNSPAATLRAKITTPGDYTLTVTATATWPASDGTTVSASGSTSIPLEVAAVQKKPVKTIYVYAFEGAGAKLNFGLDPLNTVGRQAVQEGAKAAGHDLVYHYYSWAEGAVAQTQLVADLATSKGGDKFVTMGYSYGGAACSGFARFNTLVTWDLVFTIDPVNGVPDVAFLPVPALRPNLKKVWFNHWQKVDKTSLAPIGLPIRGQSISGINNIEYGAGAITKTEF